MTRVCATCGKRLIAWLTTTKDEREGNVFCIDHFTYGGMWADSLKESTGCGKTMTVTEFAYAAGSSHQFLPRLRSRSE